MFIQPYHQDEVHFAYCYRVYIRWRTHRGKPYTPLAKLDRARLAALVSEYGISVLECASDTTDLLAEVSLRPTETISECASKLKGRVSKWLREALQLNLPTDLLSKGYFACTLGKSTRETIDKYLARQNEHHGYANRELPPIYVDNYEYNDEDKARISPQHAFVVARFHIVLATAGRTGVFGSREGRQVATEWLKLQARLRMALIKVSIVPDHVHVALRAHPAVSPAEIVVALMNSAQEVMTEGLVSAGLNRLWQSSAYIGGYGDLASPQVGKYIENWKKSNSNQRETPRGKPVASEV